MADGDIDSAKVERSLHEKWHDDLCACVQWPAGCQTYGEEWYAHAPDTFSVVEVLRALAACGNLPPEEEK